MIQALKVFILFVVIFFATSYVYYFHHDELARIFVRYGIITIPLFGLLLLAGSFLLSKLTGIPLFRAKKLAAVTPLGMHRKIVWPQFFLGLLLGLALFLPTLALLIWVFTL